MFDTNRSAGKAWQPDPILISADKAARLLEISRRYGIEPEDLALPRSCTEEDEPDAPSCSEKNHG